jgi:cytochrome d ubiquinol oxidase subunit I
MDAVVLAKAQFAFTVMYHFLFVPLSIGIGLVVVLFERRFYKSGKPEDQAASQLWIKIFAATFAIGVATGITMEFAFGTNWATYSRFVGDIFGAPLAAEGLFAFFLESTFLGVLLFGRGKVSKKFYYVSTWLVWFGSMLSALWIIIANSWMQTPAGYKIVETALGPKAEMTNFWAAALNPSTLPRYFHTVNSLLITGGFVAAAIGAYYLRKGVFKEFGRTAISIGLAIAAIFSVLMLFSGHQQAVVVVNTQPTKLAAMEGHWDKGPVPLGVVGWVDVANKRTLALELPGGTSFLASGSFKTPYPGLNEFPAEDLPPIQFVYQTYHLMVLIFGLLLLGSCVFWWLNRKGIVEKTPWMLTVLVWFWLLPQLGIQLGWATAEVGRQPWIVWQELRTVDAISKVVPAWQIAMTLGIFVVIYALLFVGWWRVVSGLIKKGPVLPADKGDKAASAAAKA